MGFEGINRRGSGGCLEIEGVRKVRGERREVKNGSISLCRRCKWAQILILRTRLFTNETDPSLVSHS